MHQCPCTCSLVSPYLRNLSGDRGGAEGGKPVAFDPGDFVDETVADADIVLGDPIVGTHSGDDYSTVVRTLVTPKGMSAE